MKRGARAEAKAKGLKRYFTGQACRNGHVAERFVNGCFCVVCKADAHKIFREADPQGWRDRSLQWRLKNPEHVVAKNREWREAHPDYGPAWRAAHREETKEASRAWYLANKARRLAADKAWRKANPEKAAAIYARYRARRAAEKAAP